MPLVILIYLLAAIALFFLPGRMKNNKALFIAVIQLGAFVYFSSKIGHLLRDGNISSNFEWIPELGINFQFTLDGLSLIFTLLITGIGALVFIYSNAYMKTYKGTDKFYLYLTIFSGAMLGLVLSTNLIQLFIFWELTSILSFLLISFFNENAAARKAAFQSLFITVLGGLSLLAGIILIGSITDSYTLKDWVFHSSQIKEHKLYLPALILILVGVFTKSAQFPFHFWLPGAMQAPTPVSAYLHSATMVKAGIFLLARLSPVLGGTPEWTHIIPFVGSLTMLVGAYLAVTQTDIKSILAYTTISSLGVFVLLLGIDTVLSVKAALLFLFVHAFYKASLFMIAGLIDKKTGTRNVLHLGNLAKYMPVTFIITILASFSMAGLPPMLGFLGKELIYEAKVQSPGIASMLLILGVSSNVLMVFVSLFFMHKVFLGKKIVYAKAPDEKGIKFLAGPLLLVLLSMFFGVFPNALSLLIEPALSQIRTENVEIELKIWHGFNDVFFLSLLTVFFGVSLIFIASKYKNFLGTWRRINDRIFNINFSDVFTRGIESFVRFSEIKTKKIQHGYHRYYLATIIIFVSLLLWLQIFLTGQGFLKTPFSLHPFYISILAVIILVATIFSMISGSRVATIIAMGVVGYGMSLIYLYYSAIDLAITQIIIETLTIVLFILVLQRLPFFAKLSSKRTKIKDLFIALSFGSVMTLLALKAINVDFHAPISDFFMENSYSKAYGENVVNVILVDFRAFDTLGEVVVLVIAALGVFSLLKK